MNTKEQFEAWWESEGYDDKLNYVQGIMFNRIKANMFLSWQAASKASEQQLSESRREFTAANATIHNLELKLTDMAVQLANAESKCRELAAGHWPRLQEQDINALMRFNETCEDGEGYDIGAEAMARLVEIGLAGKGPHGIRNITPFGQWVIHAREGEVDFEPLKTEEDNIAESALRMAQLRKGGEALDDVDVAGLVTYTVHDLRRKPDDELPVI